MSFLDLLFPIKCLGCEAWDIWLCLNCQKILNQKNKIIFAKPNNLSGLYCITDYRNKLIQKLIHFLKYEYAEDIAAILGPALSKIIDKKFNYIIPIPLHKKRYAERGFNQAELLGKYIIDYSVDTIHELYLENDILIRAKYTHAQAQLSHTDRKSNMQNVFAVNKNKIDLIKSRKILLIDDVYTTGATMNEAAKILRESGAKEIWGIVIAKG